jgi:CHAD domain-containing protein
MTVVSIEGRGPGATARGVGPGDLVEDFERLLRILGAAARRAHESADAEAVHDLRVATRRLDAALDLWRDVLKPRRRKLARRGLRGLRRELGRARELEVAVALLERDAAGRVGVPETSIAAWTQRLRRRRDRERRRAGVEAGPGPLRRIARRIRRVLRPLAGRATIPLGPVRARYARLRSEAERALAAASAAGDDAALHVARLALKRSRYAAEALTRVTGGPEPPELPAWRRVQEQLGAIQDRANLRAWLERRWRRSREAAAWMMADALAAEAESEIDRLRGERAPDRGPGARP